MDLKDVLKIIEIDDLATIGGDLLQSVGGMVVRTFELAKNGSAIPQPAAGSSLHLSVSAPSLAVLIGMQAMHERRQVPATRRTGFILATGRRDNTVTDTGCLSKAGDLVAASFTPIQARMAIETVAGCI